MSPQRHGSNTRLLGSYDFTGEAVGAVKSSAISADRVSVQISGASKVIPDKGDPKSRDRPCAPRSGTHAASVKGSAGEAKEVRDTAEDERHAQFQLHVDSRRRRYELARVRRDSCFKDAERVRSGSEKWRQHQFEAAQNRRSAKFNEVQERDQTQFDALYEYKLLPADSSEKRVESAEMDLWQTLDAAAWRQDASFQESQERWRRQLGILDNMILDPHESETCMGSSVNAFMPHAPPMVIMSRSRTPSPAIGFVSTNYTQVT